MNFQFEEILNTKKSNKVIIIGAGYAGLSAANTLRKNNIETLILESRNDIGGRIRTYTDWGFPMDLGAGWVQSPNNNPLTKIAKKLNIELYPSPSENLEIIDNGIKVSQKEIDLVFNYYEAIYKKMKANSANKNFSIQDLYDKYRIENDTEPLVRLLFAFFFENEYAADLKNLNAKAFFANEITFKGADVLPLSGMRSIFNYLNRDIDIRLNSRVKKVTQKKNEILIETETEKYIADYCICTVPLGVLKANAIIWDPILSAEKKKSIDNLEMGCFNKIYTQWEEPWWNNKKTFFGITNPNFPISMPYLPHDRNTLLSFFHGDSGKAIEKMENSDILKLFIKTMEKSFGKTLPKPKRFLITKWSKDGNTLGSYSFFPKNSDGNEMEILSQPEGNLFFAGEHIYSRWYGYAQSAFMSGKRAASQIVKMLSK